MAPQGFPAPPSPWGLKPEVIDEREREREKERRESRERDRQRREEKQRHRLAAAAAAAASATSKVSKVALYFEDQISLLQYKNPKFYRFQKLSLFLTFLVERTLTPSRATRSDSAAYGSFQRGGSYA